MTLESFLFEFSFSIVLDKGAGKTTCLFLFLCTGWKVKKAPDYDLPVQSVGYQIQVEDQSHEVALRTEGQKETSALGLLASAYGNSSDSEEDQLDPGIAVHDNKSNVMDRPSGGISQNLSSLPSLFEDCNASAIRVHGDYGQKANSEGCDTSSGNLFKNTSCTLNYSQDVCEAEKSMLGNTGCPIDDRSASLLPKSDEDSSRLHVFCLEHAAEVEQRLLPIGGAHILLLCHPGAVFGGLTFRILFFYFFGSILIV